jgi:hypothetical protein
MESIIQREINTPEILMNFCNVCLLIFSMVISPSLLILSRIPRNEPYFFPL